MAGKGQSGALTDMQLARKIRQLIYFVGLLHTSPSLSLSLSFPRFLSNADRFEMWATHSLSLSLSIYPFCGERRAVKSFMNFKQGPLSSNRARSFLIFPLPRWREGDRERERERDRDRREKPCKPSGDTSRGEKGETTSCNENHSCDYMMSNVF